MQKILPMLQRLWLREYYFVWLMWYTDKLSCEFSNDTESESVVIFRAVVSICRYADGVDINCGCPQR